MSSIGPDSHLSLASGLHRIDGPLDDLRRQQGGDAHGVEGTSPAGEAAAPPAPVADAGERVLSAPAWDSAGIRMLAGDASLVGRLGNLPLAEAAESAVDAVLDAFS